MMSPTVIAVAVDARYPLDRAALAALIEGLPGLRVVPLDSDPPPLVLVFAGDANEPARLPPRPPGTALLLVVSGAGYPAFPAQVAGLFSKEESPEILGLAIRQVARGDQYLSPALALALLQHHQADVISADPDLKALTEREREMLALLAEGLSNKAIAARLYLSVRTVEGHLASLYTHLGVHSRTEAALFAVQHNLTSQTR
jgi:DNA-binding CsgD family transcriptional regulator